MNIFGVYIFIWKGGGKNSPRVISYCRNGDLMGTTLSFLDFNHSQRFKMNSACPGTRVSAPGNFFISKGYAGCVLARPCCFSAPAESFALGTCTSSIAISFSVSVIKSLNAVQISVSGPAPNEENCCNSLS